MPAADALSTWRRTRNAWIYARLRGEGQGRDSVANNRLALFLVLEGALEHLGAEPYPGALSDYMSLATTRWMGPVGAIGTMWLETLRWAQNVLAAMDQMYNDLVYCREHAVSGFDGGAGI